eukprot:421223_1
MDSNAGLIQANPSDIDKISQDDLETIKHGKYHSIKSKCLILVAIIGFVCYLVYGIDKIYSSQQHPETKSHQISVSQYDVPTTLICNYYPLDSGFSHLNYVYYRSVTNIEPENSMTDACENKFTYSDGECSCDFNLHTHTPCNPYITDDYTQPLNYDQWTILKYNKTAQTQLIQNCWALIPPRNATFNLR